MHLRTPEVAPDPIALYGGIGSFRRHLIEKVASVPLVLANRLISRPKSAIALALMLLAGATMILSETRNQWSVSSFQTTYSADATEQGQFSGGSQELVDLDWRKGYIEGAEARLRQPDPNLGGQSFVDAMVEAGYEVSSLQPFATEGYPQAGRDGLLARHFPTSDSRFDSVITDMEGVNWGDCFSLFGVISVKETNPGGGVEYYGLSRYGDRQGGNQYVWFRLGIGDEDVVTTSFLSGPLGDPSNLTALAISR